MILVFNTLTKKKERFNPIEKNTVKMYVCGITPYDSCHLGHARCYVAFDAIRRYLIHRGYNVSYIQNFTDIDDKIIARSNEKKQVTDVLAEHYIKDFFSMMDALSIMRADSNPRVTEHVPEIIEAIGILIEKGFAYIQKGDVFFRVRKFKEYGKLSGRDIDELESGARVDVNKNKEDPLDFALWKEAKPGEPSWDSPFGKGRPGWHIECSVLSIKELAETIDIHGGGADLIFPHHENEIAQSEALTGKSFVRYWMHNGFVTINKEKMSKSLGNFFTLRDIFKLYEPIVVRTFLLSQHYRSPLDFSIDKLDETKKRLERFAELGRKIAELPKQKAEDTVELISFEKEFSDAMDDDFNTAAAIAVLHKILDYANKDIEGVAYIAWQKILALGKVLGISFVSLIKDAIDEYIKKLIAEREEVRKQKDWKKSDEIRDMLAEKGIVLEDTPNGTRWKRIK